jgi:hypothetical protein
VDFLKSESINVLHETQDDILFPVLSGVITPKQFVTCSILTYFASFVHLHRIWKQTPQPSIDHILKAPPSFSQSRTMSFSGKGLANAFSPSFLVHASFPFSLGLELAEANFALPTTEANVAISSQVISKALPSSPIHALTPSITKAKICAFALTHAFGTGGKLGIRKCQTSGDGGRRPLGWKLPS